MKTNMTLETRPCSIGHTSSNGAFSIVMLVFGRGGVRPNEVVHNERSAFKQNNRQGDSM